MSIESPSSVLASLSNELASTVEQVGRSVVAVHGRPRIPGSGLAWRDNLVVTAGHVLERTTDLSITSYDGASHPARLLGGDAGTDVAVLAVSGAELVPVQRAQPGAPAAGHLVLAVGRPGTPTPIASFGAISSTGGAWRTAQGGVLDAYVRADVALLPGLSGGALVDMSGRVIGMLSAYLAGGDPVAIPAASLDALVQRILAHGASARRGYLGVSTQPIELQAALRSSLGLEQTGGLMLLGLEPGAPADRAGLLVGDILLHIGDRAIVDGEALQMALGPEVVHQPLPLRIIRGGVIQSITVTPAERPG